MAFIISQTEVSNRLAIQSRDTTNAAVSADIELIRVVDIEGLADLSYDNSPNERVFRGTHQYFGVKVRASDGTNWGTIVDTSGKRALNVPLVELLGLDANSGKITVSPDLTHIAYTNDDLFNEAKLTVADADNANAVVIDLPALFPAAGNTSFVVPIPPIFSQDSSLVLIGYQTYHFAVVDVATRSVVRTFEDTSGVTFGNYAYALVKNPGDSENYVWLVDKTTAVVDTIRVSDGQRVNGAYGLGSIEGHMDGPESKVLHIEGPHSTTTPAPAGTVVGFDRSTNEIVTVFRNGATARVTYVSPARPASLKSNIIRVLPAWDPENQWWGVGLRFRDTDNIETYDYVRISGDGTTVLGSGDGSWQGDSSTFWDNSIYFGAQLPPPPPPQGFWTGFNLTIEVV